MTETREELKARIEDLEGKLRHLKQTYAYYDELMVECDRDLKPLWKSGKEMTMINVRLPMKIKQLLEERLASDLNASLSDIVRLAIYNMMLDADSRIRTERLEEMVGDLRKQIGLPAVLPQPTGIKASVFAGIRSTN